MAGFWIKFDTSTPDKPEVWAIAEQLSMDPDAVVGKLLRVWAWFDDHTEKGNAPSVTKALLDRRVGVSGFCSAMVSAGWLVESDGVLTIPNFDRHNGATAKSRGLTAKRVAKHKTGNASGNAKGNGASVTKALPRAEQSRAEVSHTHTPAKRETAFVPPELAEAWNRWQEFTLATQGKSIPDIQAEAILMDLSRRGADKANRDIEFSIVKGAKTILDSDNNFETRQSNNHTKKKHVEI